MSVEFDNVEGVHLVGSLPHGGIEDVSEVLRVLSLSLPGRLRRIPDGELGARWFYVWWQMGVFKPELVRRMLLPNQATDIPPLDLTYKPKLGDIKPLGYDSCAIESYQVFVEQRDKGLIAPGVRFQVSLPLPQETISIHIEPVYQAEVLLLYEQRMVEVVQNIQLAIPARDLSIQWDAAATMAFLEMDNGNKVQHPLFDPWFGDAQQHTLEGAERMIAAVDMRGGVDMGFHLCYGDMEHKHFVEPKDMGLLVNLANALRASVKKAKGDTDAEPNFVHMPVPKDRTDEAYYRPLESLKLADKTQLFLGLVHPRDLDGTKKRIGVAHKFYPKGFGVATECGMGRTPTDDLDSILDTCKEVARPYKELDLPSNSIAKS